MARCRRLRGGYGYIDKDIDTPVGYSRRKLQCRVLYVKDSAPAQSASRKRERARE